MDYFLSYLHDKHCNQMMDHRAVYNALYSQYSVMVGGGTSDAGDAGDAGDAPIPGVMADGVSSDMLYSLACIFVLFHVVFFSRAHYAAIADLTRHWWARFAFITLIVLVATTYDDNPQHPARLPALLLAILLAIFYTVTTATHNMLPDRAKCSKRVVY